MSKKSHESRSRLQVHYLSWSSQNEFIEECAKLVTQFIVKEIQAAIYYGIIVDGTPDISHKEQITFILRYILQTEEHQWEIQERLLTIKDCEKKREDIASLICLVLEEFNIDLQNCRGQGYNNGSNMSGIYKGAQACILQRNPQAIFSRCSAHTLNLCGVHSAESCTEVQSFFGNIQKLYNLFSAAPSRWKILQETAHFSLHTLSNIRSARINAVKPLAKRPLQIVESLKKLKENLDLPAELCSEVDGWITSLEFSLLITFWFKALQAINEVNIMVQSTKITLDEASKLLDSLLKDMKLVRESWSHLLEESKLVATNLGFEEEFIQKRQRRRRKEPIISQEDYYKVNVFYPAMDSIISQL